MVILGARCLGLGVVDDDEFDQDLGQDAKSKWLGQDAR